MHIILGATGHVGSATADALLSAGEPVTVVTRDESKAAGWREKGAEAAVADVTDVEALRRVFRSGRRAFLLNPPAPPDSDTDQQERHTGDCIAAALDGSGLEKVAALSTYGAQPGHRLGDLTTLYHFEQALARRAIPLTVLRAAYYMSNWDALLPAARGGTLPTMLPADLSIPMVAPADLGRVAARLLTEPAGRTGMHAVEGPKRYSSTDVAEAFAAALGHAVEVAVTPRAEWKGAFRQLGFSPEAAAAYARMTAVTVDGGYAMPEAPERGSTTLPSYIADLVANADKAS